MIISLLSIFIFVGIIIALFVSRTFSPVPYFPSNKRDIEQIVKTLQLKNDQVIYDLGAGDGIVIFAAAHQAHRKKLNTRFVAVEINPVLLAVLWLRRLLHPNKKNISIEYGDIFTMQYRSDKKNLTFFTYISPWYLERVIKNCKRQIGSFSFVSYFYPLPNHKAFTRTAGVHSIYRYIFS